MMRGNVAILIWNSRVDRQVSSIEGVRVIDRKNHKPSQEHSDGQVDSVESGHDEWVEVGKQDIPIESSDGVVSETVVASDDVVVDLVVGRNPGHPVKDGEGLEDVGGELPVSGVVRGQERLTQKYTNIPQNMIKKHFIRVARNVNPNGPWTGELSVPECKAWLRAMVTREVGQTA